MRNILIESKFREEFMDIKKEEVGDVTIFRLTGKILIGEGDEILREAVGNFADNGGEKLILDMREVPYADSSGIVELARSHTVISSGNGKGKLKLLNLSKRIHKFLEITKLLQVFDAYEDEEEAIKSFK